MRLSRSPVSLAIASLLLLAGCRVETHKDGKGGNDNVDIGTPFGSMHVKTNEGNGLAQTGMTPYPGATPLHKQGDDNSSADINMSFGGFKLGVHAVEMQTADSQDKVVAFYRKDLSRFGTVIACRGRQTVGQPGRTSEGLTCAGDTHAGDSADDLELKTGSNLHQHIVSFSTKDGGTHIGLVALDLPAASKDHDTDERE